MYCLKDFSANAISDINSDIFRYILAKYCKPAILQLLTMLAVELIKQMMGKSLCLRCKQLEIHRETP